MSKHRQLLFSNPVPQDWLDSVQEFISTLATNFVVSILSPTTLRVAAGADNAQVSIGINGKWRFNTANADAAAPGDLVIGDNDVYVAASDNSFTPSGNPDLPEIDNTVYSFALLVMPPSRTPTGTGAQALYRKVATATWDGVKFTDVRQTAGSVFPKHAASHVPGGSDALDFTKVVGAGTLAARPGAAASGAGTLYLATDDAGGTLYRSDGGAWTQVARGVSELPYAHAATHLGGGSDAISWGTVIGYGTLAARPAAAAANTGYLYLATDSNGGTLSRSNGSTWDQVARGVSQLPVAHAATHLPGGGDGLNYFTIHDIGTLAARPTADATNGGLLYAAYDVYGGTIYRSSGAAWVAIAAGVGGVAGNFASGPILNAAAGGGGQVGVFVTAAGQIAIVRSATNATWCFVSIPGDAFYRFTIDSIGQILWGDGVSDRDVRLFRSGPNMLSLASDDGLTVGSLGVTFPGNQPQTVGPQGFNSQGTLAARPAAAAANTGYTYLATDQNGGTTYRSNGTVWNQQSAAVTHHVVHAPGGADAIDYTAVHLAGTLAARPAAASANNGVLYFATDDRAGTLYRSTGSAWQQVAAPVSAMPVGMLIFWPYGVGDIPANCLRCDGAAVSRTTYAALAGLASRASYPDGSGDGATTFNLPDYRGRVAMGLDNMVTGTGAAGRVTSASVGGANAATLGGTGGEQVHTLVTAEIPAHDHAVTDPGHTHPVTVWDAAINGPSASGAINPHAGTTGSAQTGITIGMTGGGTAHNTMQPWKACHVLVVAA